MRGRDLWVANAGDSRCVASRRGRALALTHDHKPTDSEEMQRIAKVRAAPDQASIRRQSLIWKIIAVIVL